MGTPKDAPLTEAEIEDMEQKVRRFRDKQARDANQARRDAAAPLLDLASSDAFQAVRAALPALETVAQNRDEFPALRAHVMAIETGMDGVAAMAAGMGGPLPPEAEADTAAAS